MSVPSSPVWYVHKFGGTSLASSACYENVVSILFENENQLNQRKCVVVSAMGEVKPNSQVTTLIKQREERLKTENENYQVKEPQLVDKVTNFLIQCTALAAKQDSSYQILFDQLKERHQQVIEEVCREEELIAPNIKQKLTVEQLSAFQHFLSTTRSTLLSSLSADFADFSYILRACWLSKQYDLEHNWWFGYGELCKQHKQQNNTNRTHHYINKFKSSLIY